MSLLVLMSYIHLVTKTFEVLSLEEEKDRKMSSGSMFGHGHMMRST